MNAWKELPLGNVITFQRGYDLPLSNLKEGVYPVITSSGLAGFHNKFIARGPGIVTGRYGTLGEMFYVAEDYYPHNTTLFVRDFKGHFPKFIFYLLQGVALRFSQYKDKTGVPGLNRNDLHSITVALPPTLTEQRAIATALSDTDALIAALDRLIAKKKAIKQGAMQELLTGKRRLEGFEGAWVPVKLGDVLKVRHGKSQHEVSDKNGVYPILATGGQIGWANAFIYNRPSVLIGRKGTIDVPQYMDTPFWCVDTLFFTEVTEVSDRAIPKFLFYRFCLINWYNYNEASGVPSLNASTIENIEIAFPECKTEQDSIVSILADMDAEISSLERQRDKYKAVKQGMMQELLTGKTRLI